MNSVLLSLIAAMGMASSFGHQLNQHIAEHAMSQRRAIQNRRAPVRESYDFTCGVCGQTTENGNELYINCYRSNSTRMYHAVHKDCIKDQLQQGHFNCATCHRAFSEENVQYILGEINGGDVVEQPEQQEEQTECLICGNELERGWPHEVTLPCPAGTFSFHVNCLQQQLQNDQLGLCLNCGEQHITPDDRALIDAARQFMQQQEPGQQNVPVVDCAFCQYPCNGQWPNIITLHCPDGEHYYHVNCIHEGIHQHGIYRCPVCRTDISEEDRAVIDVARQFHTQERQEEQDAQMALQLINDEHFLARQLQDQFNVTGAQQGLNEADEFDQLLRYLHQGGQDTHVQDYQQQPQQPAARQHDGQQRQQEQELECSICIEELNNGQPTRALPCAHTFHAHCVNPWLQSHTECPICRTSIHVQPNSTVMSAQPNRAQPRSTVTQSHRNRNRRSRYGSGRRNHRRR